MSTKIAPELDVFLSDLNGVLRGKRIPLSSADKILKEGFKMPRSSLGVNIWGDDVPSNGLVFETGDSDGLCKAVDEAPVPVTWQDNDHCQLMSMMWNPDGTPFMADPRQVLSQVVERYKALGLTPVVATEYEFYLMDGASLETNQPIVANGLRAGRFEGSHVYSIDELDSFRDIMADIRTACEAQGVPADAVTSECGYGQFEMNLNHVADPVLAADHGTLYKRIVKGVAKKHGMLASFMAKPFGDRSGNGLHVHFSLLDKDGNNIFNDGTEAGTPALRHAVAGLLAAMNDSMLFFAPHQNSYRRLRPDTHAPIYINWGYENRTTSVRIPESPPVARRIEHRVAGADANPYLIMAAVLAAALHGIENKLEPTEPTEGNSYEGNYPELPTQWLNAIDALDNSALMRELLGDDLINVFTAVKREEREKLLSYISDVEYETYLGTA